MDRKIKVGDKVRVASGYLKLLGALGTVKQIVDTVEEPNYLVELQICKIVKDSLLDFGGDKTEIFWYWELEPLTELEEILYID